MGNLGLLVEGVGEHLRILLVCQRVDALERVAVTTTTPPYVWGFVWLHNAKDEKRLLFFFTSERKFEYYSNVGTLSQGLFWLRKLHNTRQLQNQPHKNQPKGLLTELHSTNASGI
jgi:hypothetical protein